MKLSVSISDDDLLRIAPCGNNGDHDHAECVVRFIRENILLATYRAEIQEVTKSFEDAYKRPDVTVTTE